MDFTEQLPLLSLIVIPAVGWLHRQLSKLTQESVEQEQKLDALTTWLKNLDAAMARRSELDVLNARLDALTDRLSRAEATVDRLRNGHHK
jgi:polyhydroxyalkanoate synthesis regulator phasin